MADLKRVELKFKYLRITSAGTPVESLFCDRGRVDSREIKLSKRIIPLEAVVDVEQKFDRLALTVAEGGTLSNVIIAVKGGTPAVILRQHLERMLSYRRAEQRRLELQNLGRGHEFRTETCRYCGATVDMTNFPRSPQMYCPYCDSVVTLLPGTADAEESRLRLCGCCGLYSDPKEFTEYYFYVPLFFVRSKMTTSCMCCGCRRIKALHMFIIDLLGIFAFPLAVWQMMAAYLWGGSRLRIFSELEEANSKFKSKKYLQAVGMYKHLERRLQRSAGVKYNRGIAMEKLNYIRDAAQAYQEALADCSNYIPAAIKLAGVYEILGYQNEWRELMTRFEGMWAAVGQGKIGQTIESKGYALLHG